MRSAQLNLLLLLLALLSGCATVPFDQPREHSEAISESDGTLLHSIAEQWNEHDPERSGFYPLVAGNDALGLRLWLIDTAQKSIDVQCFLMKNDATGLEFTKRLLLAADRGVRVRFLLDDAYSSIDDEVLLLADAHPNIEVRLYNPISRRGLDVLNFFGDFQRANRRMHHKSFTADNEMTIVGGRNIADEYFELRPEEEFIDLDVLAVGPVVQEISTVFDGFWNHHQSVPVVAVGDKLTAREFEEVRQRISDDVRDREIAIYDQGVNSTLLKDLVSGETMLYPASVEFMTDKPGKLEQPVTHQSMDVLQQLADQVRAANSEVLLVSPYLIPGQKGVAFWRSIVEQGVRVVMLTNSLASNHQKIAHSAYARYRKDLLEAGVELYEVRADMVPRESSAETASLHIKGMVIDRRRTFIGSPNYDPRSLAINSEMLLIIDSTDLGSQLAGDVMQSLPELAYRVELDAKGKLQWRSEIDGVEAIEKSEPLAGPWLRFQAQLFRIVPETQL